MYFTENRYDDSIESMMKGIPNFYPRGSGIVVTGRFEYTADMCDCRLCEHYGGKLKACKVPRCVCLEERIAVGVASLKEVMKETMSEIKHSGFLRRQRRYMKESEVIPMTFLSEQHRLSFNAALDRIGKYDTKNYALVAPLYLLTADLRLWNQTRRYFENHGISFGKLRPKNCSEHSYPLYCAAKDLYLGTKHITINDLADNKLINVNTFALICNAMAIRIRLEKASGEPEIKFSVITLRTEGGNISFKSEKLLIFLDLIKCYRDKVRDWENITDLETLKSLFGKSHVVKAESLPLLVNRFCNNQSVTMIADFDFVNDTVSVMKNGSTEWSAYRLKDVASAAFLAYQKPELHLSERRKIFDEYLSDREIPYKK